MFTHARSVFIALLLFSSASLFAATGHWEGAIRAPQMDVTIAVDLAKNAGGVWVAEFDNPSRGVNNFPLANVTVDGAAVVFEIKATTGGGTFRATLAADGKSMRGTFVTRGQDGQPLELPFDLTRTGDALIETAPKSAAIAKNLEGTWAGSMEVDGTQRQIGLKLSNHADGTSTGMLTSDGTEIPIARIVQDGSKVTLEVKTVGGSYAGTSNADGTEISGTWTQGSFTAPLSFRRVTVN